MEEELYGRMMNLGILFLSLIYFITYFSKGNKQKSVGNIVSSFVLLLYLWSVLDITLLSRDTMQERYAILQPLRSYKILINELWDYSGKYVAIASIGNIFVFIPFGMFLMRKSKFQSKIWIAVLIGFGFSFIIECVQYYWRLGTFEVDDLLHNSLGTYFGGQMLGSVQGWRNKLKKRSILKKLTPMFLYIIFVMIIITKSWLEYIGR